MYKPLAYAEAAKKRQTYIISYKQEISTQQMY
jgi:hypothetical protein